MLEEKFLDPCPKCGSIPSIWGSMTREGFLKVLCGGCGVVLAEEEDFDDVVRIANHRFYSNAEPLRELASKTIESIKECILTDRYGDIRFVLSKSQASALLEMIEHIDPRLDGDWPC